MGRVTYVHHYVRLPSLLVRMCITIFPQLPTLYFAVLMAAHLIDHFFLASRRLTERTKWIVFGVSASAIVLNFWWFKGVAFGIDGPINEHWGLHWRDVCALCLSASDSPRLHDVCPSLGTSTTCDL